MAKQSRPPLFLLTRPATQGARFGQALVDRFGAVHVINAPLIAPRFLHPVLPQRDFQALIFTSETGVQGLAQLSADTALAAVPRAWCVGDQTARAAAGLGFSVRSAQGDAQALFAAILAAKEPGPLLHIHGQEVRGDLATQLNLAGIETDSVVIYVQESCDLTDEARVALATEQPLFVPLFSPRTAQLFASACAKLTVRADLYLAHLSPAVGQAAGDLRHRAQVVAARPDAAAMLDALECLTALEAGTGNH